MGALADPLVVGATISAMGGVVIAVFGYRRSQKTDQATVNGGVVGGQHRFIENLQEDNTVLRMENAELRRRIVTLGGVVGIVALLLLSVESVKQDQERLVVRAAEVARAEVDDAAAEQGAAIDAAVQAEVTEQVDAAPTTTPTTAGPPMPPPAQPAIPAQTTTTTSPSQPPLLPDVTTTTVTIPIPLPTLPSTTLPEIPR